MRQTKQRDLVLKVVRESSDHPSAETVYERARKELPSISLGTVYRNLSQLVELRLVRKIVIDRGSDRYDKTLKIHAHFHCYSCGAVIDVGDDGFMDFVHSVEQGNSVKIDACDILFAGQCSDCAGGKNG